jgi:hypothetical protein
MISSNPSCSSTNVSHCVGLIGWGIDGSTEFWILKNSLGTSSGELGYIRLLKKGKNFCGITTAAWIAIFHDTTCSILIFHDGWSQRSEFDCLAILSIESVSDA